MKNKILFKGILGMIISFSILFAHIENNFANPVANEQTISNETKKHEAVFTLCSHAYDYMKDGRMHESEALYFKALSLAKGGVLEKVVRGGLANFYEQTGEYQKAIEQVDWWIYFFDKQNVSSKSKNRIRYKNMKTRLLQKIEAQKRGKKIVESKPMPQSVGAIRSLADFETASYDEQKRYMEEKLPESTDILRLSKQAMMAEHAGNFKDARKYYEQLVEKRQDVIVAQGEGAWVMLHAAVQRMSELTGDEAKEKEMLVWIKENMLNPQGQYHRFLSGLMPQVIDHLKQRINKYQLFRTVPRTVPGTEGTGCKPDAVPRGRVKVELNERKVLMNAAQEERGKSDGGVSLDRPGDEQT